MVHSAKRARRKRLAQEAQRRETSRSAREEEDDHEVLFPPKVRDFVETPPSPAKVQATTDCDIVNMVKTLNGAIAAVSQDTARVQRAYQQLCTENMARDKALADLTAMVKAYSSLPDATRPYGSSPTATRPHPTIQADVLDGDGNLRAADIGITWEGIMRHFYMVFGWSDRTSRDRQDQDRSCPRFIHGRETVTRAIRLRQLNRQHR